MDIQKILDEQRKLAEESGLRKSDGYIKQVISIRERIDNLSLEERKIIAQRLAEANLTVTKEQTEYIWSRVWGPDRGKELYESLTLELKLGTSIVEGIARGNGFYLNISEEEYKLKLQDWHNRYGYNKAIYIARTPGNDLLDYYDSKNALRGKPTKLKPSDIFNIRFRWEDKSRKAIKAYCDSLGIKVDGSMYDTYRDKLLSWLVDKPHTEYMFDSLVDLTDFLESTILHTTVKTKGGGRGFYLINEEMIWYDKTGIPGWSFIKKSKQ